MLNIKFLRYSLGNLTQIICVLMVCTLCVSLYFHDGKATHYISYIVSLIIISFLLKYRIQISDIVKLRMTDLFFTTSVIWFYFILICMIPYINIEGFSVVDAFFEMSSGVTTTGASIIDSPSKLSISISFWRSITQWLGGVGFVVISVLILPNLNSGGMKLFKTESSDSEEKSIPHYRKIALNIVVFYFILSFVCMLVYWFSGMDFLKAMMYSFTSVSTGGFSPDDEPFTGLLDKYQWGALFIYIAALPFQVIALAFVRKKPWKIFTDPQIQVYTSFLVIGSLLVTLDRFAISHQVDSSANVFVVFKQSIINMINISTSTGYTIENFYDFGSLSLFIFIFMVILGACSGSTAGGLKIFRFSVICKFIWWQLKQTVNPNSVSKITYNKQVIANEEYRSIIFFFFIYFFTFVLILFLYVLSGLSLSSAASSLITCLTNSGASYGYPVSELGSFATQTDIQKVIGSFAMILGRLEFLTFYALLIPKFWKFS